MDTITDREVVVNELKNMVSSLAHKYDYRGNDYDDLYQVGMQEVLNALDHYDKDKGASLSSFSYVWIRGGMLKYIRENNSIKVSKDIISLNKSINKAKDTLTQKYNRVPTKVELAQFLEMSIDEFEKVQYMLESANVVSSDLEIINDRDGKSLNIYDYYGYEDPGLDSNHLDLNMALSRLSEEEQKIIDLKYYQNYSQESIAKEIGTNQVGVSRKLVKVLGKLKNDLAA